MIRKSFSSTWESRFQADRDSYRTLVSQDLFEGWERSRKPDWKAQEQLLMALEVFYSRKDDALAMKFLEKGLRLVERALAEKKPESELCKGGFPLNRGRLLRVQAYFSSLLGGRVAVDEGLLLQASKDIEEWCRSYRPREWDSQAQANYLAAVRLSLVAGDLEKSRELLDIKKKFKFYEEEYALWRQWVDRRHAEKGDWAEFDAYFHQVRDPNYVPDVYMEKGILMLELGILRHRFIGGDSHGTWQRVLEMIAA